MHRTLNPGIVLVPAFCIASCTTLPQPIYQREVSSAFSSWNPHIQDEARDCAARLNALRQSIQSATLIRTIGGVAGTYAAGSGGMLAIVGSIESNFELSLAGGISAVVGTILGGLSLFIQDTVALRSEHLAMRRAWDDARDAALPSESAPPRQATRSVSLSMRDQRFDIPLDVPFGSQCRIDRIFGNFCSHREPPSQCSADAIATCNEDTIQLHISSENHLEGLTTDAITDDNDGICIAAIICVLPSSSDAERELVRHLERCLSPEHSTMR